ncbi:DUF1993 family protein [Ideonella sp.]|uniref:DUF1993 family protein n=1 Tax=Ideonella sp. TaxID=1929293 RepID=UPI003BB7FE34
MNPDPHWNTPPAPEPNELDLVLGQLRHLASRCTHLLSVAAQATPPALQASLLAQRLAPDMLCLAHQVVVLADSLVGAAALLAGRTDEPCMAWVFNRGDPDALGPADATLTQALARLQAAEQALSALQHPSSRDTPPDTVVVARPGHARHFALRGFLWGYLLPNGYFHASMIYALLRQAGLPVGKADFEGPPAYRLH